jgi:phosphoglycolate phosphatase
MPIQAVLFDLDGTLLDTLVDVGNAANAALRDGGFPEHPLQSYRHLLGGGVQRLFGAALPTDNQTPELIEQCVAAFRRHYEQNWNDTTRPYAGIPELIAELHERDLKLAVLSNKAHNFTRRCIAEHFGGRKPDSSESSAVLDGPIGPFQLVVGQRPGVPPKPDPTSAIEVADALGVPPDDFLYLGDTSTDMQTARDAGMHPIGVLWGFRDREELVGSGAEAVIAKPRELLELVEE